ncbi:hypothetical protein RCCGEPOP_02786 [Rhizobium sp. Pop5]|nr:hypothetical protein RCCGEPOP_02786 [Rhizobium sp. Pop5]
MSFPIATILLTDAQQMVTSAITAARALNVPSLIAIVDASGQLLSFARQDGAMAGSVQLAIDKAFTAYIVENSAQLGGPGAWIAWDSARFSMLTNSSASSAVSMSITKPSTRAFRSETVSITVQ